MNWEGQPDNNQLLVACVFPYDAGKSYFSGNLIWLKTTEDAKTIITAAKYCQDIPRGADANLPWRLPTIQELKKFYEKKEISPPWKAVSGN